jgi:hypothetical protein
MKVSKILDRRLAEIPCTRDESRPHPHASVGIEYEIENLQVAPENLKRWQIDNREGSIINGVELVSDPVWGTAIGDALAELDEVIRGQKIRPSFRTSVHIHLNILDMEVEEVRNLIKLYLMYEPALFRQPKCVGRENNIFCVPAWKSVEVQQSYSALVNDLLGQRGPIRMYLSSKYAAMNPNSVRTFGTLEFRHMGGTDDVKEIDEWINILLQLKVAAQANAPFENRNKVWGKYSDKMILSDEEVQRGAESIALFDIWR